MPLAVSFQGVLNIDHKPILHVSLYQPLKSFICIVNWNYFYVWVNFMSTTEVYHFSCRLCTTCIATRNGFHSCQKINECCSILHSSLESYHQLKEQVSVQTSCYYNTHQKKKKKNHVIIIKVQLLPIGQWLLDP